MVDDEVSELGSSIVEEVTLTLFVDKMEKSDVAFAEDVALMVTFKLVVDAVVVITDVIDDIGKLLVVLFSAPMPADVRKE